ncbi:MAG: transcriptional repressor [Anaerolineae bacterium]|nr:transcriptional repressor [Anaerolineae bacterium]
MSVDTQQVRMAQALREAGYRLTQPRLAVLQVLQENEAGLNPEEIHQLGKTLCPSLGLVTVYRTLDLLAELGLARRLHSEHQCHSYASARTDRHYLICERCHRVIEFPCHGLDELLESVRQHTGYTINEHLLELRGLCPDCQENQAVQRNA